MSKRSRVRQHAHAQPVGSRRGVALAVVVVVTAFFFLAGCGDDSPSTAGRADCQPRETIYTASPEVAPRPTLPEGDAALVAAVTSSFCSVYSATFPDGTKLTSRPRVTPEDAACIGTTLVERLGPNRVRALRLGLGPWSTLGLALSNQIDRTEATLIVDTFKACSKTWKLLLITSVTQGADDISEQSALCISGKVSDDTTRSMFIGEIDRAYDDPLQPSAQPYPQLVEPLVAAFDVCLTPEEQDGMDWN